MLLCLGSLHRGLQPLRPGYLLYFQDKRVWLWTGGWERKKKFVLAELLWATPVCRLCFSSACPLFSPILSLLQQGHIFPTIFSQFLYREDLLTVDFLSELYSWHWERLGDVTEPGTGMWGQCITLFVWRKNNFMNGMSWEDIATRITTWLSSDETLTFAGSNCNQWCTGCKDEGML